MASYRKIQIPNLETGRLLLRPVEWADAPRIQQLFSNPDLLRYMNAAIPFPYPPDGAETFLRAWLPRIEAREVYAWSLLRKDQPDEGAIGQISLTPASDDDHRGFWLGEPYWRQGYMKEAVAVVTDFAFDALEMPYLLLNNAEPNVPSHRLKETSGATIIGRVSAVFVSGTFPRVQWKLTPEAWRLSRDAFLPSITF